MRELWGLIMLATIKHQNKTVGIRLFNTFNNELADTTIESIIDNLVRGREINNLSIVDNKLKETLLGGFENYTKLNLKTRKVVGKAKYIIYNNDDKIIALGYDGKYRDISSAELEQLLSNDEVANKEFTSKLINISRHKDNCGKFYIPVGHLSKKIPTIEIANLKILGKQRLCDKYDLQISRVKSYRKIIYKESNIRTEINLGINREKSVEYTRISNLTFSDFIIFILSDLSTSVMCAGSSYRETTFVDMYLCDSSDGTEGEYYTPDESYFYKDSLDLKATDILWLNTIYTISSYDIAYNPELCKHKVKIINDEYINYITNVSEEDLARPEARLLMLAYASEERLTAIVGIFYESGLVWKPKMVTLSKDRSLIIQLQAYLGKDRISQEDARVLNYYENKLGINKDYWYNNIKIESINQAYTKLNIGVSKVDVSSAELKNGLISSASYGDILAINELSIENCVRIGDSYLYKTGYINETFNILTKLSPEYIRNNLYRNVLLEGPVEVRVAKDKINLNTVRRSEYKITYSPERAYNLRLITSKNNLVVSDSEINKLRYEALIGEGANKLASIKYIGLLAYSMIFKETPVYIPTDSKLLDLYRQRIIGIDLDIIKGSLVVYIGYIMLVFELSKIQQEIVKYNEMKAGITKAQNIHAVLTELEVDNSGYILFSNPLEVNNRFSSGVIQVIEGINGIRANAGSYKIGELIANKEIKLDVTGQISIGTLRILPGGEGTYIRVLKDSNITTNKISLSDKCKFTSTQYKLILSLILESAYTMFIAPKNILIKGKTGKKESMVLNLHNCSVTANLVDLIKYVDLYAKDWDFHIKPGNEVAIIKGIITKKELRESLNSEKYYTHKKKSYGIMYDYYIEYSYYLAIVAIRLGADISLLNGFDSISDIHKFRGIPTKGEVAECLDIYSY